MGLFDVILGLFRTVKFLFRLVMVGILTVAGWVAVREMVAAGELPAAPLGLAEMGLPATLLGLPTAYAGGILLFAALLLFGDGSGGSTADGDHVGGFGDADGGGGGGE